MRYLVFSFSLLLGTSPLALAYGPCDSDEEKLCQGDDFHGETEKNCLHFNAEQVTDPMCKEFLKKNAAEWQKVIDSFEEVKRQCKSEVGSICPDLKDQSRRVKALQTCLMSEREKLGADCKKEINRHIKSFQPHLRELE